MRIGFDNIPPCFHRILAREYAAHWQGKPYLNLSIIEPLPPLRLDGAVLNDACEMAYVTCEVNPDPRAPLKNMVLIKPANDATVKTLDRWAARIEKQRSGDDPTPLPRPPLEKRRTRVKAGRNPLTLDREEFLKP